VIGQRPLHHRRDIHQVDAAPIGDFGDQNRGDALKRGLRIQRARQHGAGLCEQLEMAARLVWID